MTERPNTVAGLLEKHREIAGKIEHHRQALNALVFDLEAVEHTIRMFDPAAVLPRAKPQPSKDAAFRGEMRRDTLNALRTATGPLTSLDIARQVIAGRKLTEDAPTVQMIRKRVSASLWKLAKAGIVREVALVGDYKGWQVS
ncbi:hypothetical protein [Phenylobacterium sp.]|uniref:hypothetical protein n=1 Tax=Phenylobacterium sp. TaxID=1871053 RepID=UPI002FC7BC5E